MEVHSDILIDEKNLLLEVANYYDSKERECSLTINNAIETLQNQFQENLLPSTTNAALETLDLAEITYNLKIPSPIQIGHLEPLNAEADVKINAFIDFISGKGICIQLNNQNETEAHQFLQNIGLKILLSLNPSVVNVILIDPEGSGSNFKLMLGYEKAKGNLILNKSEIGGKLAEVLKSFNKLQTDNLTYKYDNLEELNLNEPKLTKPYTFIFISNYPSGFKKEEQEILESIILKGHKFGTFVLMSYDPSIKPEWIKPDVIESLIKNIALLKQGETGYQIYNSIESDFYNNRYAIELEKAVPSSAKEIISLLNSRAKECAERSVSQDEYFDKVLNNQIELWQEYANEKDKNTGIKVPVGLKSATEELEFTFDCGTDNYHAIIGGKTGSGKTVLLDNIIINASIKYSPKELQFVLLDFKGASFQKYRNLPHLRILFGGNDRGYGLNVLRFLNDENTRRQAILANLGGKSSALTKAQRITNKLPRIIIILDEFQVLLKEIDSITREANRHIDTIAQQGRSAGMHLILSSQDLTGITISDSAQFNSNVRIALQMDPNACKQIFSMENTEASLLEKRGEAIYNEKPGKPKHANQRFQIYKLEDNISKGIIDFLNERNKSVSDHKIDRFFLPNENSASITNNNELIQQLSESTRNSLYPKIYLGEPSFIKLNSKTFQKEDSHIQFKRAENSNLLMAGNDMNTASTLFGLLLIQLLKKDQHAKFHLINNFGGDKIEWRERFKLIESAFTDRFKYYQKNTASDFLVFAEDEINQRKINEEACSANVYFIVLNLDSSFQKQGFTVSEQSKKLVNILKQGPDLGVHTIIYSYSAKSLSNAGIESDLFESKIVLRGDSKDIVKINEQKEPTKEKMFHLYAPSPVTSINPDLINVYSRYEEEKFIGIKEENVMLIKEFLKDFKDDE